MGKEAREARRERERLLSSHPAAAAAAGWPMTPSLASGTARRPTTATSSPPPSPRTSEVRLDIEEIHAYVDILRRTGYDWPAATYLPMSLLGAELVRNLLADLHRRPSNEAELGHLEQLGMALLHTRRPSLPGTEHRWWPRSTGISPAH